MPDADDDTPCAHVCCDCLDGIEQVSSVLVHACTDGVCISESDACAADTGTGNPRYCD